VNQKKQKKKKGMKRNENLGGMNQTETSQKAGGKSQKRDGKK